MEEKKIQLGELEASLVDKLDAYSDLTKVNPNITSETRIGIIRNLIKDFLEGKVLTKDFIELDKENYYYFNKKELLEKGTVKAVHEEPSSLEFGNYLTVKKIVNNLDSFDAEIKSYCYGNNSNRHKGLFIYFVMNAKKLKPIPLVFDLVDNELTISLIKLSEIEYLIKTEEDVETIEKIKESVNYYVGRYIDLLAKAEEVDFIEDAEASIYYNELITIITSVIEDYKGRKAIDLLVKYDIDILGASSEGSLGNVNLNNPIEDLVNSNVAKDKEIKELEEKYKKPAEDFVKKVEEVESLKQTEEGMAKLWNEVIKEQEEK